MLDYRPLSAAIRAWEAAERPVVRREAGTREPRVQGRARQPAECSQKGYFSGVAWTGAWQAPLGEAPPARVAPAEPQFEVAPPLGPALKSNPARLPQKNAGILA